MKNKLVVISTCSKCPKNYFNVMPSLNIEDGKSWCALSDRELDTSKQFKEIPDWCLLPEPPKEQ